MKGRNEAVNWKLVLVPVAVLSVAFAAGTKFFFGDGQPAEAPGTASIDFGAGRGEEPEALASRKISVSPGAQGSSLEMFQEVNKEYSSDRAKDSAAARARLAQAGAASGAAPSAAGAVDAYGQYARAQMGELDTPAVPDLPKGPAPWMKGAPGTGSPTDPALSMKTAVAPAAPEARKSLSSSRNFGRAGFSSGAGQTMGRDRLGSGRNADLARGSDGRFSANTVANSRTSSPGFGGEGGGEGGLSSGSGSSSAGGGSSASGSSSGGSMGGPLTTAHKEKPFPFLAIWPNQVHFGTLKRYETAYRVINVMNTGGAALKIKKVSNLDPDAPFSLANNTCDGKNLAPGEGCSFRVKFSPLGVKDYITGFEVETDDNDLNSYYAGLIEAKGVSVYNYWAYLLRYNGLSGTLGKADFGQMSAGASNTQNIYVINTSDTEWRDIKLDKSGLPAGYSVTSETCTGKTFGAWGYCRVTVKFAPTDDTMSGLNRKYGKYNTVNVNTKASGLNANPRYPEVIDSLNFSRPKGVIKLKGRGGIFNRQFYDRATVTVEAEACSRFPVKGLFKSGRYWYFR